MTDNAVKPFWSWNDNLKEDKLIRQIEAMKDNGIDGFFMHARRGLMTKTAGQAVLQMVLYPKREKIFSKSGWNTGCIKIQRHCLKIF